MVDFFAALALATFPAAPPAFAFRPPPRPPAPLPLPPPVPRLAAGFFFFGAFFFRSRMASSRLMSTCRAPVARHASLSEEREGRGGAESTRELPEL